MTAEAKETLFKIEKTIEQIFNQNQFVITDKDRAIALNGYLKKVQENNDLLMVRSTGAEDTKELANAGGNKSIPAVKPDIKSISVAIGQVVASYFSEKSISQRLIAKDPQLFGAPFMPVVLQVMVGKNPVSGVMFSQEAEGNTKGVTQIQATYGHGEGVVNGLVPVDTFYIGISKIIHPLIRKKDYRIVPSADFSHLEKVPNQGAVINNPCLTPETIINLKKAADEAQRYFGYSVDMEFVVQEKVIYLVQVRPIITKKREPSYLKQDFIGQLTANEKQSIFTILSAGGAVRIIDNQDAIIVSSTIRKALFERFLKSENKDSVQAVVIGELAPALSHEANVFNGAGKSVAYTNQLSILEGWLSSQQFPLLIDMQRGLIALFKANEDFAIPKDAIVTNSWLEHPIAKYTSLFSQFLVPLSKQEIEALNPQEFFKEKSVTQLLDMIKNASDDAANAIKSLLARLWSSIIFEQNKKKEPVNKQLISQLKNIFAHAMLVAHEVLQVLKIWKNSAQGTEDRLQRLYPVVFLEALVRQLPSAEFINAYSFSALIKTEQQEEKISAELGLKTPVLKEFMIQYAKAGNYALTNELNQAWQLYLKQLGSLKDIDLQQSFARMMLDVANLKVIPLWLNNSFAKAWQKGDALLITNTLLQEYQSTEPFFKVLQQKKLQLDSINSSMALWEEPDKYQKQRESLIAITQYFEGKDFKNNYEKSPSLGKAGALSVMNYLVSTFDTSIKTLEASKTYTDDKEKISRFKVMLYKYFDLLQSWAELPSITGDIVTLLDGYTFKTINEYWDTIEQIIVAAPHNNNQLQGSSGFNVAAASLGSKALWSRSIGNAPTLEDMFTLIHQNLLVILAQLAKKAGVIPAGIPPIVNKLIEEAEKISIILDPTKISSPSLIGINFDGTKLTYYFNLPILHHSNTFQITYDLDAKQTTLGVQFVGAPLVRWQLFGNAAYIMSVVGRLPFKQTPIVDDKRGLIMFSWLIENESQATRAIMYVQMLAQFVTTAWQSIYGEKTLLEVVAGATDPQNKQVIQDRMIETMINSMTQMPGMALFLDEIMSMKNNNLQDPAVKSFYQAIKKTIAKAPSEIQNNLFDTLDRRIKYNMLLSFDDVLDIVEIINLKTHNSNIIKRASEILTSLKFKLQDPQLERMAAIAQKLFKMRDNERKSESLAIIDMIVSKLPKQHILDLALTLANQGLKITDTEIRRRAITVFETLVKKGYALQQALQVARQNLNDSDIEIQKNVFSLLNALVQKGVKIPVEQVLEAIDEVKDPETKKYGLFLIDSLRISGLDLQRAINIASKYAFNFNLDIQHGAYTVLRSILIAGFDLSASQKKQIEEVLLNLLKNRTTGGSIYYLFNELLKLHINEDIVINTLLKAASPGYFVDFTINEVLKTLKQQGKEKEAEEIKAANIRQRGEKIKYIFGY